MKRFNRCKLEFLMGIAIFMTFALILVSGCQTAQPAKTPQEMSSEFASAPKAKLILGPGDVLDFKFFYNTKLNGLEGLIS